MCMSLYMIGSSLSVSKLVNLATVAGYVSLYCSCVLSSLQLGDFTLHHVGSLCSSSLKPFSAVRDTSDHPTLTHMLKIIERAPKRLQLMPRPQGEPLVPMVLVAMDIRLDPDKNSKVASYILHAHTSSIIMYMHNSVCMCSCVRIVHAVEVGA